MQLGWKKEGKLIGKINKIKRSVGKIEEERNEVGCGACRQRV